MLYWYDNERTNEGLDRTEKGRLIKGQVPRERLVECRRKPVTRPLSNLPSPSSVLCGRRGSVRHRESPTREEIPRLRTVCLRKVPGSRMTRRRCLLGRGGPFGVENSETGIPTIVEGQPLFGFHRSGRGVIEKSKGLWKHWLRRIL